MNAPPSIFDIRERAAPVTGAKIAGLARRKNRLEFRRAETEGKTAPVICSPASDRVTGGILFVDGGRAAE